MMQMVSKWIKGFIEFNKLYREDKELFNAIIDSGFHKYCKLDTFLEQPKLTAAIIGTDLYTILKNKLPDAQIWLSDRLYYLTSIKELKKFLKHNKIDLKKYVPEYHDCDDYSYELMGFASDWCSELAFGILWGKVNGGHAINLFVDDKNELYVIEPQTDKITPIDKYKIKAQIIMM